MNTRTPISKQLISTRGENKTFTMKVPSTAARITKIIVSTKLTGNDMPVNRHYIGVDTTPGAYNNAFVQSLGNEQMESTVKVFSVNAGVGQHVYYARPSRLDGVPSFEFNGSSIGFSNPIYVDVTDPETGYQEEFAMYESNDTELGEGELYVY